jgi:hypothetical protein
MVHGSPMRMSIKSILVQAQNRLVICASTYRFTGHRADWDLIRLGTDYGGWSIPSAFLEAAPLQKVAVVSVGLGFDVSFDHSLLERGVLVIGLDPLPASALYAIEKLERHPNFFIEHSGLGTTTGQSLFFAPKIKSYDSWSLSNIQQTDPAEAKYFNTISLADLFIKYKQELTNARIGLKMDIEGGELQLIKDVLSNAHRFDFVAIEIDFMSLIPFLSIFRRLKALIACRRIMTGFEDKGFVLASTENFNFLWVKSSFEHY